MNLRCAKVSIQSVQCGDLALVRARAGDLLERPYEPYLNALGAAGRSDERSDWADDNIAIPLRCARA